MKLFHDIKNHIDQNRPNLWAKEVCLNKNDLLIKPGTVETKLYFVEQGSLRVFFVKNDEELTVRFGYPKSFISSLDSFLNGTPSLFYIQAIKKCTLLSIEKGILAKYISEHGLTETWVRALSELVAQQVMREIDILTTTPLDRYQRLVARSPHVLQEVPHKYIASYLRMAPETFSRLLKS